MNLSDCLPGILHLLRCCQLEGRGTTDVGEYCLQIKVCTSCVSSVIGFWSQCDFFFFFFDFLFLTSFSLCQSFTLTTVDCWRSAVTRSRVCSSWSLLWRRSRLSTLSAWLRTVLVSSPEGDITTLFISLWKNVTKMFCQYILYLVLILLPVPTAKTVSVLAKLFSEPSPSSVRQLDLR